METRVRYFLLIFVLIFYCFFELTNLCWAGWGKVDMGTGTSPMYGIDLGEGRNDGVIRIYSACGDTRIYEFSWDGRNWIKTEVGSGASTMKKVIVKDGRNDSVTRIYGGNADKKVYEFTWVNGTFIITEKVNVSYTFASFDIGFSRDDGVSRLHICHYSSAQFTDEWRAMPSGWEYVGYDHSGYVNDIIIGPGRGDGKNRRYHAPKAYSEIWEYTYSGGWSLIRIEGMSSPLSALAIGAGRSDDFMCIYGAGTNGFLYECRWAGVDWNIISIYTGVSSSLMTIAIGDAQNEGKNRVYAGNSAGSLFEFTWTGSTWTVSEIMTFPSSVNDIVIGDGRNIGENHIYVACGDNHVYEVFIVKPSNLQATSKAGGKIELTWDAPPGMTVSYYNIYRATFSGVSKSSQKIATGITETVYTDTSVIDGVTYYYCVTAFDGVEETDESNVAFAIADASPPEITHTPVTQGLENISIRIKADVVDVSHQIGSVTLYYRKTGDSSYSSVSMSNSSDNEYIADIPADFVTDSGIDYYIKASDSIGNEGTKPATNPETNPYQITVSESISYPVSSTTDNSIETPDGGKIVIPAGAITSNTSLVYTLPDPVPPLQNGLDKNLTARDISLSDGTDSFSTNITITLPYNQSDISSEYESKLAIYKWNGERWEYCGGTVNTNANEVSLATDHLSIYAIILDSTSPTISDVLPSEGDFSSAKPEISAKIIDNGCGIDENTISVKIDDTTFNYSSGYITYSSNTISFNCPTEISAGKHSLEINVSDKVGNTASFSSSFSISDDLVADIYNYPSPFSPDEGTTFRYILSENCDEVKIYIFNLAGTLLRELKGTTMSGVNNVYWDGKDSNGDKVTSDVFIVVIKAKGNGKELIKRTKIIGWKLGK